MSTTEVSGERRLISASSARPSMRAIRTSEKTTSNCRCPKAASASSPLAASSTSCPRLRM